MKFWNNFLALCNNVGKSPNAVAKEIGVSSASVSAWKSNGDRIPQDRTLLKVADYFGVTVDELKRETPGVSIRRLSKDEAQELAGKMLGDIPRIRRTGIKRIAYITEKEKAPTLSEGEKALIELFRQLPPEKQELVAQTVKAFADSLK